MRMWMVDPAKMCDQHLLGEHVELHMFVGSMQRGTSMAGYCEKGLMEPRSLLTRHTCLVAEMERRGMNHQSPMSEKLVERLVSRLPIPQETARVDEAASLAELQIRCENCRARGGEANADR